MRTIQITAASRLHFGLLAPMEGPSRRFGGAGVMIESPGLRVSIQEAPSFEVTGLGADRASEFAARWRIARRCSSPPPCRVVVEALPKMHTGLGVGTQLALAIARGLDAFVGAPPASPIELARSVGRGERSAVGTYGFFYGGLIVEPGKAAEEDIAPLELHLPLPAEWRWLLVCPRTEGGLHGTQERLAFAGMQGDARALTHALTAEMKESLIPAAKQGDFAEFSASLYRYGFQSGLGFAAIQGGPYNGPVLQRLVEEIRSLGIEGVAQSSWGPTIFALCRDEPTARSIAVRLALTVPDADMTITASCNHGAVCTQLPR